jgi:tRNA(Ile)-lysidine synthetase-like protein
MIQRWADKYGVQIFHRIMPENLRKSPNFQEVARDWRRSLSLEILASVDNTNGKYLVTAHHREDQVETVLLKFLRGTFISNIFPVKSLLFLFYSSHFSKMRELDGMFLRPFLNFHKEDLTKYLVERSLEWSDDSSNLLKIYKRNKIRLDLVPLLNEITGGHGALESRLFSLSQQSSQVDELIKFQVRFYLLLILV